jgi:ABC-type branched-subunit amino acid transport system ATPase component
MVVEQNAAKALSVATGAMSSNSAEPFRGSGHALLHDPEVKRLYLGA